jgi:hypothetical protein
MAKRQSVKARKVSSTNWDIFRLRGMVATLKGLETRSECEENRRSSAMMTIKELISLIKER